MTKIAARLFAGFSIIAIAGTAHAGATGWYFGGGAGAGFLRDSDDTATLREDTSGPLQNNNTGREISFETAYDTGYLGSLTIGHIFDDGLRGEFELRYGENDIDTTSNSGGRSGGTVTAISLFANLYYDFNKEGRLHPYIGGGGGFANFDYQDVPFAGPDSPDGQFNGDDRNFVYQGATGIAFDLTDRLTADLGYRYMGSVDPNFRDGPQLAQFEYDKHVAMLSLRFVFAPTGRIDSDGDGVFDENDNCPDTPAGVEVDGKGCPLDSDGDGVPDFEDKCPGTESGVKVNADGCPLDSDGDGVPDTQDKCPNTAQGTRVDDTGCPLVVDTDGDGVPDNEDDCPGTPAGQKVLSNGCAVNQKLILKGVKYEFNSAELTPQATGILNEMARTLKDSPGFRIELSGHTDSKGSDSFNQRLSQRRAESAREYLIEQGVRGDRIVAKGYGESRPIAPNTNDDGSDNPEGRAKNRRTEVMVLDE